MYSDINARLPITYECGDGGVGAPPVSCSLSNTTIDYGDIIASRFDGAIAKANTTVQCNVPADVTINMPASDISLSNGTKATLSVNGGSSVSVNAANSATVEIASTLHGRPEVMGAFSGSGVIIASYN